MKLFKKLGITVKDYEPLDDAQINAYFLSKPFIFRFSIMSILICAVGLSPIGFSVERILLSFFTASFTMGFMITTMSIDLDRIKAKNRQTHEDET